MIRDLPDDARVLLEQALFVSHSGLLLRVDDRGVVHELFGNPAHWSGVRIGDSLGRTLAFAQTLLMETGVDAWNFVSDGDGGHAHVWRRKSGEHTWMLLIDASGEAELRRLLQQRGNTLHIENERLKKERDARDDQRRG
ncbi:MAG: hypothetical protein AAGD00_06805 [Planctomycetota bacterium]